MNASPILRRRFFLIDNPRSGRGSRRLVDNVLHEFALRGCVVERAQSGQQDEVLAAASRAVSRGTCDAVIAAGGDGTIRLAAALLRATTTPLGIIPLGTGNVLAHELGLPRTPAELADVLMCGEARPVAMATANAEPFLLMAGIGFDGHVIAALDHAWKARVGKLAYGLPVLGALARTRPRLAVEIEGIVHTADWVVIANARCYGGRFVVADSAGIETPGLVAVLVEAATRTELAATLVALARGTLTGRANVRVIPCVTATIRADRPVPAQIDGDAFQTTPIRIASDGGSVHLIMPPRT